VTQVHPDSPAEMAGMQVGDLIVAVDGRVVIGVQDLTAELVGREPGDELRVQYARENQLRVATIPLAGPDGIAPKRPEAPVRSAEGESPSLFGGFGAAIGGLLGGRNGGTAAPAQAPPRSVQAETAPAEPAPAEAGLETEPETLPAPKPEIE
jgi:membrane-associated protease RseP (regulator of RpoE activity)